jgi:hypothetical protein
VLLLMEMIAVLKSHRLKEGVLVLLTHLRVILLNTDSASSAFSFCVTSTPNSEINVDPNVGSLENGNKVNGSPSLSDLSNTVRRRKRF